MKWQKICRFLKCAILDKNVVNWREWDTLSDDANAVQFDSHSKKFYY